MELRGCRVFFRVGGVDTVHTGSFQHDVCFNLDTTQAGAGIGGEERIAGSGGHDDYFTGFHAFDGTPFIVEFADGFHAHGSQYTGLYTGSYQSRTECKTVDDCCQHSHLVAFHTVKAFVGTAQSTEYVSAAYDDAYLYSQSVDFLDLRCILGKAFFVDAVLFFSHQALAAEFQ